MAISQPLSLARSPSSSSITLCPSGRASLDHPSPLVLVDQQYNLSEVYGVGQRCSMTPPMDHDSSLPSFDAFCQPEWTGSALLHPSSSGSPMPSVPSSGYDSYEAYDAAPPQPYGHEIYQAHHVQAHTGATPRSTDASSRFTVSYPSVPPVSDPVPSTIKMEHVADYSQGLEIPHYPSPGPTHTVYANDTGSYASSAPGYLSGGQSWWRTSGYSPAADPDHYRGDAVVNSPFIQNTGRPYRGVRPRRTPRRLTTREEANFQCEVKGCGKLFSRSYNFKAHMETHDEKREYPFPCLAADCNKKFVRKTDLQRHHQSVHMKERNHKCDYCGRPFARKDTLTRHMEDGCSKRFDIAIVDLRSENTEGSRSSAKQRGVDQSGLAGSPPGTLPPMTIRPLGSNSGLLTSMV